MSDIKNQGGEIIDDSPLDTEDLYTKLGILLERGEVEEGDKLVKEMFPDVDPVKKKLEVDAPKITVPDLESLKKESGSR